MSEIRSEFLKVTLVKSAAGRPDTQRKTLRSLKLSRIGSSAVFRNVNPILGQLNKVIHLIKVEVSTGEGVAK